jgi:type IV secretory pathway VirB2 component (pilin)
MKKKILLFVAVLLCSMGMVSILCKDDTFATAQCSLTSIDTNQAEPCAKLLNKNSNVNKPCNEGGEGGYDACVNLINTDKYITCGSMPKEPCKEKREELAKGAAEYLTGMKEFSVDPDDDDDDSSDTSSSPPVELQPVDEGACTSILPSSWCDNKDGSGIQEVVGFIAAILTGGVVIAGTIGLIICGIMWMTARDNENQVMKAKKRMVEIVIGIVAWILMYALANLFIPKSTTDIEKGNIQLDSGSSSSDS